MPTRPLNPTGVSPATAAMFDLLSDGQWHPNHEIIAVGAAVCRKTEPDLALRTGARVRHRALAKGRPITTEMLLDSGARDIARNRLMIAVRSGRVERDGNRHRMLPDSAAQWRQLRFHTPTLPLPLPRTNSTTPTTPPSNPPAQATTAPTSRTTLTFGGLTEAEGFDHAPLIVIDRVHFRAWDTLPLDELRAAIPQAISVTVDDGEGLYRVDGPRGSGQQLAQAVKEWCHSNGYQTIGLRAEHELKRRNLKDLPPQFLAELCQHYHKVGMRRVRRSVSTVRMYLPDTSDIEQQVYEWILEAVARFDHTKGVPFGAFFATRLAHWIHDLSRKPNGRPAADIENRHHQAEAAFVAEHHRRPTEKELADYMGVSVAELRRSSQLVATVNALRNTQPIDTDEDEPDLPLPSAERVEDDIIDDTQRSLLSQVLVAACAPDADGNNTTTGRASRPNVLGLITVYATTWGGLTKTEVAARLGTSLKNLRTYTSRVEQQMRDRITTGTRRDLLAA